MTDQASLLEETQPPHIPQCNFFERCGHLGVFVLLAKRLDNTQLKDPETGTPQPSLRDVCSSQGICYVRVRKPLAADGQYWADVWADADAAASSDITASSDPTSDAYVILSDEDLIFALPLDVRLEHMDPAQILRLMQAHARELAPVQPRTESVPVADSLPPPSAAVCADRDEAAQRQRRSVEVTEYDIPERLRQENSTVQSVDEPTTAGSHSYMHIKPVAPDVFQQALLHTMQKALKRQLAQTHNQTKALELKALCALVTHAQEWQRQTCKRVVHVEECSWCARRQCWVWRLLLEIPKSLLVEPAVQAAAA